jgi:2-polyprenyl-3-methyl-5-hydroxy-6-metoxy-1,4-benzoquinol methylase
MQKDAFAELYRAHHEKGSRYGYLYCGGARSPYLKEWIGKGKRVLDLGCRDGMLTQEYVFGNEVIGVDIDKKALELIKKRLGIETLWLDLNKEWPFEPESFDVIVACEILEHLFFMEPFLEKVQQTLKKGGLFIGSVPNAFRVRNRLKFLMGNEFETDPTHVRQFSFARLTQVLGKSFSNVEIVPIEGKILPLLPVSRKIPRKVGRLFAKDLLWRAKK